MNAMELNDFDGLLHWPHLHEWFARASVPGDGAVVAVTQLGGGSQNNIFRMRRADGTEFVLRRPPRHLRANSNATMVREATVLRALADSDVPHPHFYDVCDDLDVIGTAFYVMAPIDGFTPSVVMPGKYADDQHWQDQFGFELVDAAARLAAVDVDEVGLQGFGKADGWLERQVPRWRSQLDSYQQFDGYDGPEIGDVERVERWLEANRPSQCHIGVIHGDYQFANVMFASDEPRMAAMVDWELSTLGDPLLDLAWMMQAWNEPDDPPGKPAQVQLSATTLRRADLVARYGERTGRTLDDYPWYFTLACFKLGIILEGSNARAAAGLAPREIGDLLHGYTVWLFAMANQWISQH